VDPLSAVRSDHHCFGCGGKNPIGLHLRFTRTDDGVSAPFVPVPEHQGFEQIVHGGILSTVLDEAMAWAVASEGIWAVTGDMRTRFRRPLHIGEPVTVAARVTGTHGRTVSAEATLTRDQDRATIATAAATFVRVPEDVAASWRNRYLREATAPKE
jgi:uncharacterized protein (TIGR00369 family)